MRASLKSPLVWIDCEMTGLDLRRDALIEVAVVVTDGRLAIADPGIDVVVRPPAAALAQMGDVVRAMHTRSGLLGQLDGGLPLADAQARVLDYIRGLVPERGRALLAGNSVATDKAFLEAQMPEVIDHLHYRIVDVSSVKELAKRWFHHAYECAPVKHGGHRALADIRESIQELEYYRRALFPEGAGPSRADCLRIRDQVVSLGIALPAPGTGEPAPAAARD